MIGVLRHILLAPVTAPGAATLWLAKQVKEQANREMTDPAALRSALAELEQQLLAGDIDEATYDAAEERLLLRLGALE